jgi:hypothetical protein
MSALRRFTDGVLFQAVLTGSLSFSHIHDLAAVHGQTGWKAWLYPLSVDLLTVAAYRKLMAARHAPESSAVLAWCAFLLGLFASLAANVVSAWQNPDRLIAVALGVWPAVAFLVCTLLSHDTTAASTPAPVSAEMPAPVAAPAVVDASARVLTPTETVPVPAPAVSAVEAELLPELSPRFLEWARGIAEQHQAEHGSPMDLPTLTSRLKVNATLARALHAHLVPGSAGA